MTKRELIAEMRRVARELVEAANDLGMMDDIDIEWDDMRGLNIDVEDLNDELHDFINDNATED